MKKLYSLCGLLLLELLIAYPIYANCGNGNGNGNGCGGNGGTTVNNTYITNQTVNNNLYQSGNIINNTVQNDYTNSQINKFVGELDLNIWDGETFAFDVFDGYAFADTPGQDVFMDGRNDVYGFRLTWKLGPSHTEDEIKELRKEIKELQRKNAR